MPKITIATITVQRYNSFPNPNGWAASAGLRLSRLPSNSSAPLPVSTSEWTPSATIAALPVNVAATNLLAAIARVAAIAAQIAPLGSVFTDAHGNPADSRAAAPGPVHRELD